MRFLMFRHPLIWAGLRRRAAAVVSLVACILAPACVGCTSAEYEARLEAAKKKQKLASKFVALDASPVPYAQVKQANGSMLAVSLRKPLIFNRKPFQLGEKNPNNPGEELSEKRLKPPFLKEFPGYQSTYEALHVGGGKNICYLFLGAQPAEAGIAEKVAEALKPAVPEGGEAKWTKVSIENEDGTRTDWNRIAFSSEQEYNAYNNVDVDKYPSNFVLYMREHLGCQAFVGIRWTIIAEPAIDLESLTAATLGTVTIAPETKK